MHSALLLILASVRRLTFNDIHLNQGEAVMGSCFVLLRLKNELKLSIPHQPSYCHGQHGLSGSVLVCHSPPV